ARPSHAANGFFSIPPTAGAVGAPALDPLVATRPAPATGNRTWYAPNSLSPSPRSMSNPAISVDQPEFPFSTSLRNRTWLPAVRTISVAVLTVLLVEVNG